MTSQYNENTFLKFGCKYYKIEENILQNSSIEYRLLNPLNDNQEFALKKINEKDKIHSKHFKKFIEVLDLCKRKKINIEYMYDTLIHKYKFTIHQLKKIVNNHAISNYDELFKIENIIKAPFNFITQEHSLISFEKAEMIVSNENLKISFDTICEKWSYHSIRSTNMGYVPIGTFWQMFDTFCNKKNVDKNKHLNIINKSCIFVEFDNNQFITTQYQLDLEKEMGNMVQDLVEKDIEQFDQSYIHEMIEKYESKYHILLNHDQKNAVVNGINSNFSIITGYPGTGKTTITHCILWIFQELNLDTQHSMSIDGFYSHYDDSYSSDNSKNYSGISVLAPTGKAYINIFDKLNCFNTDPNLSGTIHKCIYSGFYYISISNNLFDEFTKIVVENGIDKSFAMKYLYSALANKERTFNAKMEAHKYQRLKKIINQNYLQDKKKKFSDMKDYLVKHVSFMVIDEASMIDNFIFSKLLKWAIRFECRVLILGDEFQLPSVENGIILEKMINSKRVPLTRLTEIRRQDDHSGKLVEIIRKIPNKEIVYIKDFDNATICFEDIKLFWNEIKGYDTDAFERIVEKYGINITNSKILSYFRKVECSFCTPDLNIILQNIFNKENSKNIPRPESYEYNKDKHRFKVGDLIIRRKNDYTEGVLHANGEEAIITKYNNVNMCVSIRYQNSSIDMIISIEELYDEFYLSYAITIHNSQGSQYDIVVLFIQSQSKINQKIIYTAISRAVKKCVIISTPRILTRVQQNKPVKRYSLFMEEDKIGKRLEVRC